MTFHLAFLLILCVGSFSLQAQTVSELEKENVFDFWIGTWDATWDEPDGNKGRGVNTITKELDATVLVENFEIIEGQNAGFKGKSISVYQPQFDRWKQAWADNNGGYFDFTGEIIGESRIFKTDVAELQDGQLFVQRMVFKEIKEDSMTWDWESSSDGGKTWTLNWRIYYTKKP